MSDSVSRVLDALERKGRTISLRRRIGTSNSFTEVSPLGYDRGYKAQELLGGIVQGDREVVIGNAEIAAASWPAPVRKGDVVVMDGVTATVQGARSMYVGTVPAAHILWVRG
jgi:hypothetical protein